MTALPRPLRVLELAGVLAGPSVGLFFAELGAKVYKVEAPKGGDVTRHWRLPQEANAQSQPESAYYASVNWNKEVLWLDLHQAEDRAKIYALMPEIDVVLANYKAGSAQRLGMDFETLRQYQPKLIYAQLSGFGAEDEHRVAFDVVLQAESGFMHMNGQADSPPTKMPVALIDVLAAHQLKQAVLLGLWQREIDGQAHYFEVSLLRSALAALANQASNYLMLGHVPQRMGSLHPNIAPYGEVLQRPDSELVLVLAIGSDAQFAKLVEILGCPELAQDPRFATNPQRVREREALWAFLQAAYAQVPEPQAFLQACHQAQVPIGQVRDMRQVFELSQAQAMILPDAQGPGRRVRTVAFEEKTPPQ